MSLVGDEQQRILVCHCFARKTQQIEASIDVLIIPYVASGTKDFDLLHEIRGNERTACSVDPRSVFGGNGMNLPAIARKGICERATKQAR